MKSTMLAIHDEANPDNVPQSELDDSKRAAEAEAPMFNVDFVEFIRELVKVIDSENHEEELRRVRKITKNMRYYRGEQRGFWSASTGEWVTINPDDFEPRDAAMLLINNQFRPMVKSLSKEWSRSRSRMKVSPRDDTVQKKGASRYATSRLASLQDKLMPESFRQTESKSAFLAGNYLRYSFYNRRGKGDVAHIPNVEKFQSKTHDDLAWCPSCDKEMPLAALSDEKKCPFCKAEGLQIERGREQSLSRMTGVKKVKVGCPDTRLIDVREVKIHLRARNVSQTPYLRRRQYLLIPILKEQFPWANLKPMPPSPVTRYIQETELSVGGPKKRDSLMQVEEYGLQQGRMGGFTEFVQLWIRPALYFQYRAKKDVKLGGGEIMKQGDKYIEKYPEGMYVALSGEELLDVQDEIMDDYWAHGAYETLIESFWGDGLDDLIPMQELVNEMQSLFVENIIYNASPKIIYNPFLIEAAMLSNNPSEMTPMSRNARRDDKPSNAVYQMSGMSIARDVPEAMIKAMDDMRTQSGAHLSMQGSNDPRLSTATAMAIARDASVAQLGPPLALKSEVDVTWAYQILKLCQKFWVDGVSDKMLGNYSIQEAKWFKECDIESDLEITVEPGSWIPRTELEVRNDFLTFVTAGGLPLGFANPAVPYEVKQKAAELMRMPIELDKLQPDIRNAHIRCEQVQQSAEALIEAGVILPETSEPALVELLTEGVPVDMYIDEHPVFIDTYKAWLKTDEGRFAPAVVADSIRILIQKHMQAMQMLQDEAFQAEAKYATTAKALEGMVEASLHEDKTEADTKSAIAKEEAKAMNNNQQPTAPIPSGGSERPTTQMAEASNAESAGA